MRGTVIVLGLLGLVWQIGAALAQTYPTKPVRVIVAQSAWVNMDIIARIVTPKMSDARLGSREDHQNLIRTLKI